MPFPLPARLQKHINPAFRSQSWQQLSALTPREVIPFIDSPISENYTIVLRPPFSAIKAIAQLQSHLRIIEPNHYYYPADQLHLTLLGKLAPTAISAERIVTALQKIRRPTYKFVLYGTGSNQYGASVSAYPEFDIVELRTELRQALGTSGDDYTFHLPAYEQVGWINFLRYGQIPAPAVFTYLRQQRAAYFGEVEFTVVQLYRNRSKVLSPSLSELIYSSHLID